MSLVRTLEITNQDWERHRRREMTERFMHTLIASGEKDLAAVAERAVQAVAELENAVALHEPVPDPAQTDLDLETTKAEKRVHVGVFEADAAWEATGAFGILKSETATMADIMDVFGFGYDDPDGMPIQPSIAVRYPDQGMMPARQFLWGFEFDLVDGMLVRFMDVPGFDRGGRMNPLELREPYRRGYAHDNAYSKLLPPKGAKRDAYCLGWKDRDEGLPPDSQRASLVLEDQEDADAA